MLLSSLHHILLNIQFLIFIYLHFFEKKYLFLLTFLCLVYVWINVMCVYSSQGLKRTWNSLDLDLMAIVSHLTWVLGIELQPSGRPSRVLSYWAMTVVLPNTLFMSSHLYILCIFLVWVCLTLDPCKGVEIEEMGPHYPWIWIASSEAILSPRW